MKGITSLALLVAVTLIGTKFVYDAIDLGPSKTQSDTENNTAGDRATTDPGQSEATPRRPASPKEIVAMLFEALKKGDRETVEGLLSPVARKEMPKYGLKVEPLGSPDGQYQITKVEFPKGKSDTAYVACIWKEPRPNGTIDAAEVVWVVRKQSGDQWRITGMAVESPQKQLVFFDFERPDEMIREWERLNVLYAQQEKQSGSAAATTAGRPRENRLR